MRGCTERSPAAPVRGGLEQRRDPCIAPRLDQSPEPSRGRSPTGGQMLLGTREMGGKVLCCWGAQRERSLFSLIFSLGKRSYTNKGHCSFLCNFKSH